MISKKVGLPVCKVTNGVQSSAMRHRSLATSFVLGWSLGEHTQRFHTMMMTMYCFNQSDTEASSELGASWHDGTSIHVVAHHHGVKVSITGAPGFVPPPPLATLCPCLRSPAVVVYHLFLVAVIAQRVRWQRCWGAEDFSLENAAARVCREAGGRVTTSPGHGPPPPP